MGKLFRLEEARGRHGRHSKRRVFFTRHELNRLLSLYSRRVMSGEWRDYAIDLSPGMAVFSVFRHSHERPLFAISKRATGPDRALERCGEPERGPERGAEFTVSSGGHRLARSESLPEALKVFDRHLEVVRAGPY